MVGATYLIPNFELGDNRVNNNWSGLNKNQSKEKKTKKIYKCHAKLIIRISRRKPIRINSDRKGSSVQLKCEVSFLHKYVISNTICQPLGLTTASFT